MNGGNPKYTLQMLQLDYYFKEILKKEIKIVLGGITKQIIHDLVCFNMRKEEILLFIPTQEAILEISPTDFEKYALELLQQQTRGLEKVKIVHNKIIKAYDGNYQLDGYIEFEAMGVMYKTIVECKHYKKAIPREIVQKLYDNLRALGAQKGILISTSNFQSGAIEYAKIHGIALIQLVEAGEQYCCRGKFNVIINRPYVPYNAGCPYIGVLQMKSDIAGITCSYLSNGSTALKEFIVTIE